MGKQSKYPELKKKFFSFLKNNALITGIVILALTIRVVGTIPGHPPDHPDEPMSYGSATEMILHNDFNPGRFDYPAGVPLVHLFFYNIFILPIVYLNTFVLHPHILFQALTDKDAFQNELVTILFGKNGIHALYWSRIITAFLGAGSVALTYLIGKKLFNKSIATLAAFFISVNYRHVLSSHLALSDIPNCFFALFAIWASSFLFQTQKRTYYIFAAIAIGLSISMKYQVYAAFPFAVTQIYCILQKKTSIKTFFFNNLLAVLIAAIVFVLLNPYLFLNLKTALPVIHYVSLRYGAGAYKLDYYTVYYLYIWGLGKYLFLLTMLGIILSLRKKIFVKSIFLLAYVLPFLYTFIYYFGNGGIYVRNYTTVLPLLCLFAALALYTLVQYLPIKKNVLVFLLFCLAFFTGLNGLGNSVILDSNYSSGWTRDTLDTWATKSLPKNAKVLDDNVALKSTIDTKLERIRWDHLDDESVSDFINKHYDFAVINISWYQINLFWFNLQKTLFTTYNGIPYQYLENTYNGLALSEFLNYSVFAIYKSWQAPDNAYLVLKPPKISEKEKKTVAIFDFTKSAQGWIQYDFFENKTFGNSPRLQNRTLLISKDDLTKQFTGYASPFIPVDHKKIYLVEAKVKNNQEIDIKNPDGFFRIDYYRVKSNPIKFVGHAVSTRIRGSSGWKILRVVLKIPEDVHVLRIAFQRSDPKSEISYELATVELSELPDVDESFKTIPYRKTTVPEEVLFPIGVY